jgi:glycosyltransferase involved in cell wall biosynthesis
MVKTLQVTGNSAYGGAGYLILRWCRFLLSKSWSVDVLATDPFWVNELQTVPGLRVIEDIFIPRDIAPLKDLKAFAQLCRLIKREGYQVVHTYTATPGFIGRIAACLAKTPVILHHEAGWTVTSFSPFYERIFYTPLEYLASLASTKAICVSHAVEEQGRKFHLARPNRLVVICNGIQPEPFIEASKNRSRDIQRSTWGYSDRDLLIGSSGRLSPQKNIGCLVQAMAHVNSLMPDMPGSLLLAGEGPERDTIIKLAGNQGINDRIRLLGFVKDIPAFLAAVDIFVSSSLWEGMSISVLEAMAAAKPIIASNILPNAELIEHEHTGLLVDPQSPEQIAEAVARFIRDPLLARNCGLAARQRVIDRYTIERMFQETWDLHNALLSRKHKGTQT